MLWRFSNIFKVLLTFFDFCIQKTIKKSSDLSEKGVASDNFFFFFFLFEIQDKVFEKTVS